MQKIYLKLLLLTCIITNAQVASTTPTGSSQEVGVTAGELSVTLTGSATYNIPLMVPPGINGVEPKIGLFYSNNNGNGVAGFGWDISGLSAITRIPSSIYHDNVSDPVDFDALDRFSLEGQRLIVKNGTSGVYGANNTVYETENFSNVKITSYGVHPNGANYGPAYFIVQYPDGSLAHYGNSTDSRTITTWSITYWQNAQGIRINYFYTPLNNNLYLSSIKYGNIGTTQTLNEIQFTYIDRLRTEQGYIAGQNIEYKKILSNILIKGNNENLRNYLLEYSLSTLNFQRLSKIYEKNGDNSLSYNPTVFNYDVDTINTHSVGNLSITSSPQSLYNKYLSGDYDGDGKTDLLYFYKQPGFSNQFHLYNNLAVKTYNYNTQQYEPNNQIATNYPISTLINGNPEITEAFNSNQLSGDSSSGFKLKNGWVLVQKTESFNNFSNFVNKYAFKSYTVNSAGNVVLEQSKIIENTRTCQSFSSNKGDFKKFLSGDFNGDGITDAIAISVAQESPNIINVCVKNEVFFVNLKKDVVTNYVNNYGEIPQIGSASQNVFTDKTRMEVIDFDGDGRSDFLLLDKNCLRVFTLSKTGFSLIQLYSSYGSADNITENSHKIHIGDYNGDGKTDVAAPISNLDSWKFFISNGLTFVAFTKPIGLVYDDNSGIRVDYEYPTGYGPVLGLEPIKITYYQIISTYIVKDLNGDGKSDIYCQRNKIIGLEQNRDIFTCGNSFCYTPWVDSYPVGDTIYSETFSPNSNTVNNITFNNAGGASFPAFANSNDPVQFLDFNSNQSSNELIYVRSNSFAINKNNFFKQNLLTKITTGNGVQETITYKPLVQEGDSFYTIYKPTLNTENYPNIDLPSTQNLMVVSKIEKQSNSTYKQRLFSYYGGVSNVNGLGFLGFRQVTQTNWHNPNIVDQVFSDVYRFDIALRGAIWKKFLVNGYIPPYTFSWENDPPTKHKLYNVYNSATDATLPNKVFKLKLNQSQEIDVLTNITTNSNYPLYNAYNQPTSSVVTTLNGANIEKIVNNSFGYEHFPTGATYIIGRSTNKSQTITLNPSQSNQDISTSEEIYSYNTSYLLSQIKKRATNSNVTTNYLTQDNTYDPYGNLTKKKITAVGMTPRENNYQYSSTYGYRFLTKSIDVDGLETTYTYNSSTGNLLTETLPSNNGYPLTTTFSYDTWGKKINTQDFLGNNQTIEYLKQNEKTLVTKTNVASDGNSVSTELLDDLGRNMKSGTKTINDEMSYIEYEYDNKDRVIKVSDPHYEIDLILWNQTTYDGYGRINQMIDAKGKTTTINYVGLTTTTNDGTKIKQTVKNSSGDITSLTETPGGTVNYSYFANGNLKSTIYDGGTTTIIQDGWGRKKELNDPAAGLYKYTFNDLGELTKEENPNGFTDYTYSSTGKLLTKWVKNATAPTTTNIKSTYTYNPTSKLLSVITIENPNDGNNTITYNYDNYRRLTGTIEDYTTIQPRTFSKTLTFDSYGRVATETISASAFGISNTKTTCSTYLNGFSHQLFEGSTPNGNPIYTLDYQDARGNVLSEYYGNGLYRINEHDQYGYPFISKVKKGKVSMITLTNTFDQQRGNLLSRANSLFSWNETFDYDTADRLIQYKNILEQYVTQDYSDSGKIETNHLGTYNYTQTNNPFKNTSITDLTTDGQAFSTSNAGSQNVSYNAFNSPIDITQSNEIVSFGYNASEQRSVMYYGSNAADKMNRSTRKYYSADGSVEIKYTLASGSIPEKVEFFTYIGGDAYSAPIVVRKIDNGAYENFYLHRDHLGSIIAISNSSAAIEEKRLFDAWGAIIKVQNSAGVTLPKLTFFDRGYTGHEHIQGVDLINMNGRIYDPKLHRFLQPDNNIQDPFNTQNFNRYGYVLNNPLKYSDPSGESWLSVLYYIGGAILSSYISTAQANNEGNVFKWNAQSWQSFGMGAASTGASVTATNYGNKYVDNYNNRPNLNFEEYNPVEDHEYVLSTEAMWKSIIEARKQEKINLTSYSLASNMWNSPMARLFIPDKIGFSLSSSVTVLFGMSDSIDINWITRGNDGSFIPYVTSTLGAHVALGTDSLIPTADAFISPSIGWYNALDMRSVKKGEVANGLLGPSINANAKVKLGVAGSIGGSVGFRDNSFSDPLWFSFNISIGVGTPAAGVNVGASNTYQVSDFKRN